jgi:ribonuclease HI
MNRADWEVKLCWVKAHAGILENELADTLAKKATTNGVVTRELEEESVKKWQRDWTQTTKGSITK